MTKKTFNCVFSVDVQQVPPVAVITKLRRNEIGEINFELVDGGTTVMIKSEGLFPINKVDFRAGDTAFANNGDNSGMITQSAHTDENTITFANGAGFEFMQGMPIEITIWEDEY